MTEFLKKLIDEIEGTETTSTFELGPIESGEEVIGELTDDEKKLILLHGKMVDETNKAKEEHDQFHQDNPFVEMQEDRSVCKEFAAKSEFLEGKLEIVNKLFWMSVETRLNSHGEGKNLGIREGWKIVSIPKSSKLVIDSVLRSIFD